ncbi:MAG: sugar phosphate nucleotidyltransferase [Rhodospirillales bacterium]|jgi:NDP-sugar pyrophosphorylase family protein
MATDCLKDIDVVVLAGGLGTRIYPVLKGTPKILAPIGGRPYLVFLLSWLKNFGAKRVVFGLGHLAGAVSEFLEKNPPKGIEVTIVIEGKPLGTAGAITNVRSEIRSNPVLILNGDSFVDADLCDLVALHKAQKSGVTLLCTNVSDASRYGTVNIDSGNRVSAFQEKTTNSGSGFINAGVYLFAPYILDEIACCGSSLEVDFFQKQPTGRVAAMSGEYTFLDIGTPEDLARAPEVLGKYYS